VLRKIWEAALTPLIALIWPKQRVLETYLNVIEFGPGLFGVEAAAQFYFNKHAAALSLNEGALLAAVLPSPLHWSPMNPSPYLGDPGLACAD
jgi:monofunctional biosynthetic peptidoglycan transglycosylase